jgi:acyl-CoA dehydrogenase
MSENHAMLVETGDRLFADIAADPSRQFDTLWGQITQMGLLSLLVQEDSGGFGGDWVDAVAVMRLAGYHALPAPLGEAMVAARLVADCGFSQREGLTSIAAICDGTLIGGLLTGQLKAVAWGRVAESVVGVLDGRAVRVRRADATAIRESQGPAGDPRDTLDFQDAPVDHAPMRGDLFAVGALTRVALIAGALDAALQQSVEYANGRVQFGQPIGKFQAVQQCLAVYAEESAAVNCALMAAALAMDRGDAGFEIAAAKYRAGIAADIGHATAHQVHGAIGFTWEHQLHRWTRRLVSWASEFGSGNYWADRLGTAVVARGPDAFWADITNRSD